jgi:hypothetical protein
LTKTANIITNFRHNRSQFHSSSIHKMSLTSTLILSFHTTLDLQEYVWQLISPQKFYTRYLLSILCRLSALLSLWYSAIIKIPDAMSNNNSDTNSNNTFVRKHMESVEICPPILL